MSTTRDTSKNRSRSGSTPGAKGDAAKGHKNNSKEALFQAIEPMRPLLNMIKDAIVISDMEGNIAEVNDAGLKLSRCSRDEFIGRNAIEIIAEKDRQAAIDSLMKQTDGAEPEMTECTFVAPDGTEIEVDFTSSFINDRSGSPVGTMTICRDITERKRMEADLEKAAEKLQIIIESIGDMLFITDLDLNIVNANEAAIHALGFSSEEELIGKSAAVPVAGRDRARVTVYMGKALAGKGSGHVVEYALVTSDGKEFDVEANTEILHDCAGMTVGLVITARDITDRKRMQAEVKKSAEKLNTVLESMSDGVIVLDMFGSITEANDTAIHMFEYSSKEELIGKSAMDTIAEQDKQKCADAISQSLEAGKTPGALEFAMITATGREFEAELATSILHDSQGNLTGFVGVIRNITERKRMQEELEKSAEKLRTVIESIGDMLFITDMDLNLTNVNEAAARLLGYADRDVLIGKNAMDPVAAKDRARIAVDMAKALSGQDGSEIMEYTLLSTDGTELDVESNSEILRDCSGQTVGLIITARDVTERKRMQEAVRESEEKMRVMFESINDAIVVTDLETNIVDANEATLRMFRYARGDFMKIKGTELIDPKDLEQTADSLSKSLETGQPPDSMELTILTGDGGELETDFSIAPLHDSYGNTTGFVVTARDITERNRMEEEVRNTAEKLRVIFEAIKDGIILVDTEGKVVDVNEGVLRLAGFDSKDELIGIDALQFVTEEDREQLMNDMANSLAEGTAAESVEYKLLRKDGTTFDCEMSTAMLNDADGNPMGFVAVERDVTERKRMQEELRKTAEKLRIMFETIGDMFIVTDMNLNIVNANEAAARLLGHSSNIELAGKSMADLIAGQDRAAATKTMKETLKTKSGSGTSNLECKFITTAGKEFDVEATTDLLRDCSGMPSGLIITARDVTERKQMEAAVQESSEKLRATFDAMQDGIFISTLDGHILDSNEAAVKLHGYSSKEDLIGVNAVELVAERDREKVMNYALEAMKAGSFLERFEYTVLKADGSEFDGEFTTVPLRDKSGEIVGWVSLTRDITERKKMQDELRESVEKLRVIFDSIADGITVSDFSGTIIDVNDAVVRMSGSKSRDEMIGTNGFDFVPDEDRERITQEVVDAIKQGRSTRRMEYAFTPKKGRKFDVDLLLTPLNDSSGNPTGFVGVTRDISETKRMIEALRDSEEKKRLIFESLKEMIMVVDLKGDVVEANDSSINLLGYIKEELIGMSTLEFVAEKDREGAIENAIKLVSVGVADDYIDYTTLNLVNKNGEEVEVEYSTALMRDSTGTPTAVIGIAHDISERRRMEKELIESAEKLKSMFESIKDPVILSDMAGNILDVNDAALRISGWPREKWIGINALEVVHEKDHQAVIESLMKQMEEGPSEELTECTFVVGDGRELEVDFSSAVIHDSSGEPIGTVTVARDITERKRAEKAIRESEEKLRTIFNSVRDGIIVIDLEGKMQEFNEAVTTMTGYSREELAGKSALEFVSEGDREEVIGDLSKTLDDRHTQTLTSYRLLAKGNKVFDAELSSGMMLDSDGNPTALIGVMRDVTDRKLIEQKLIKTKDDLERSNRELEQFAYVASHDLQEPLRMVSSYLKLLERRSKDKLDTEAQEFIDFAVDGSTRMAGMIQALLTYSRVGTRGKPFEPTDCGDILNKALSNLQIAIEEKGASVTHDPLPTILADGTQMLQLFQNLIGNGLKFQDDKRPEVHVSVEDKGDNWAFSFRDNGIGIDPKYKDRIFVIFERLHGKGEYKGTGIGLAVCKKIVERHGGEIWVDSIPGEGATFSFTMPKERKESDNAGN